jgi:hypothetical protein
MPKCNACGAVEEIKTTENFLLKFKDIKYNEEVYSVVCKSCQNLKYGYSRMSNNYKVEFNGNTK